MLMAGLIRCVHRRVGKGAILDVGNGPLSICSPCFPVFGPVDNSIEPV